MNTEVRVLLDIPFHTVPTCQGERTLVMDLWLPVNQGSPCPTVVYIHGGGWYCGTQYRPPFEPRLYDQGIAVAAITYRFSGETPFPACLHDCKTAVRWLRAHAGEYNLDPTRFAAWGISAGGHLVSLLAATGGMPEYEGDGPYSHESSAVQAVVNWCGPIDLERVYTDPQPGMGVPDLVTALLGSEWPANRALASVASPIWHVRSGLPPHLLVFGGADPIVPSWNGSSYHEKLISAGVYSELVILPGVGHDLGSPEAPKAVDRFIQRFLRD
jgi:acetyl esterase/lipase